MAPATKKTGKNNNKGDNNVDDKTSPSKRRDRDWGMYSHIPPSQTQLAKNGRQKGRNLITWNRPRMYEKLLLHLQYECARQRVDIPWDHIAHRLNPGSSGNAISQQLVRLRQTLVVEGHLVPPPLPKPGASKHDPKVRGFARKFIDDSGDAITTEPVGWNEPFEDRRRNLPDAADYVDDEEDSMAAAMTGDDTLGSVDFEDVKVDTDADDQPKSAVKGKAKGKMPIKRQSSEDGDSCEGGEKKKAKTSIQPPRAAVSKKSSSLKVDDHTSETSEDEKEHDDGIAEIMKDCKEKKDVETSADESLPSCSATPAAQPVSTTSLPDPFMAATVAAGIGSATLSPAPVSVTSATPFQQQLRPSPAYSPLSAYRQRHRGGVMTTPSPIRSIPMNLMMSPNGDAWTVLASNWGGGQNLQVNNTPMEPPTFVTANSSPGNFDLENATPRTAAAMRIHLNDWNEIPSMFTDVDQFEEQLQRSVERRERET